MCWYVASHTRMGTCHEKIMNTPVNPTFFHIKRSLLGFSTHGLVNVKEVDCRQWWVWSNCRDVLTDLSLHLLHLSNGAFFLAQPVSFRIYGWTDVKAKLYHNTTQPFYNTVHYNTVWIKHYSKMDPKNVPIV